MNKNIENIIEEGMMEYSGYILLNRCIPDLRDSCKPVIRRILYTMNKVKATNFMKSQNIEGKVMEVHPHGGCYPAMVGMVQTDNQLLPWLTGKGNFAQHTSRDLQASAPRYSECKLSPYAVDVFKELDKNIVKWIPNYDGTIQMPEVLPVKFPTILNYCQEGIGVGMASKIPSFNMIEVAEAIIKYNETGVKANLIPDFATGGYIINNKNTMNQINTIGKGSIKLRGKCNVTDNIIQITEIPYSTTREEIMEKVISMVKDGKFKEIDKIHDLTGLKGMCIEVVCKKNANPKTVVDKLYRFTGLESTYSCNINVLCDGLPKVMGVWDIIDKWLEWRDGCLVNKYREKQNNLKYKLHLYEGLIKIFFKIDDVIEVIKESLEEKIIDNLMEEFDLTKDQADFISDIKLRNLNKVHISKTVKDKENLEDEIKLCENILNTKQLIRNLTVEGVIEVAKKFGRPRNTLILSEEESSISKDILIEDYNCRVLYTNNYIKKHLKLSDNHKLKEDEIIIGDIESNNKDTLMIITNKANRYKIAVNDLDTVTPSSYGQYIPSLIELEEGEKIVKIISVSSDKGDVVAVYKNGKIAKIGVKSFLSANKKLVGCYNQESELLDIQYVGKDTNIFLLSSNGKGLIINTKDLNTKVSRNTQGVTGIKLKDGDICVGCKIGIIKDDSFNLHTTNDREIYIHMDNVSADENKNIFDYISGRVANQGNHIFYSSSKNVKVDRVEF